MKTLSIGKLRGLQQCSTDRGVLSILALDQPLSYSLDPARKKLASADLRRVVIESARRLVLPGVDVLKAEFPLDVSAEADERIWAEACAERRPARPRGYCSRRAWILKPICAR